MDANPFIFDIARLGKDPLTLTQTGAAPVRLGAEMMVIAEGTPVEVTATIYPLGEGVQADITATGTAVATCVRCLREHQIAADVQATGIFALSPRFISQSDSFGGSGTGGPGTGGSGAGGSGAGGSSGDEDDDVPLIENDLMDVTQLLIDEAGTQFPFNPTCLTLTGTDCSDDADVPAPDGISGEQTDPRWDALKNWGND